MSKIFINYRRSDSQEYTVRIHDRLVTEFGKDQVYLDTSDIPSGALFPETLEQALSEAGTMLVVIGPDWLQTKDKNGEYRLDDPDDFVVREIAVALERGIKIIPILVKGATMPEESDLPASISKLYEHNAVSVQKNTFHSDIESLVENLRGFNFLLLGILSFFAAFIGGLIQTFHRNMAMIEDSQFLSEAGYYIQGAFASVKYGLISLAVLWAIKKRYSLRMESIITTSGFVMMFLFVAFSLENFFRFTDFDLDSSGAGFPFSKEIIFALRYMLMALAIILGLKRKINKPAKIYWLICISTFLGAFIANLIYDYIWVQQHETYITLFHEPLVKALFKQWRLIFIPIMILLFTRRAFGLNVKQVLLLLSYISIGLILSSILLFSLRQWLGQEAMTWGFSTGIINGFTVFFTFLGVFRMHRKKIGRLKEG